jgi:glutaredoxin 2
MAEVTRRNSNPALEAALTQMIQNMAALVAQHTLFVSHLDEDRRRFNRIERKLEEMEALLVQHNEILKRHDVDIVEMKNMLRDLPEAIRQKIGFKPV